MTGITTEEKANRIVKETEQNLNRGFCPLINDICVSSCVCYVKTRWNKYQISSMSPISYGYDIVEGHCGNAMFFSE